MITRRNALKQQGINGEEFGPGANTNGSFSSTGSISRDWLHFKGLAPFQSRAVARIEMVPVPKHPWHWEQAPFQGLAPFQGTGSISIKGGSPH
jgi:hypothetical protein